MHHTSKDIFLKCWLWSVIIGSVISGLFWFISDTANLFHGHGTTFSEVLFFLSIVGEYLGAGLVGWRLVDKYYPSASDVFMKSYLTISLITFVASVIIVFSPVSPLGLLWSLVPPLCVVRVVSKIKEGSTKKARK